MSSSGPSVLLINPPITAAQRKGPLGAIIKNLYFNSPPLGIAYIASLFEQHGISVDLVDAAVEGLSHEQTLDRIRAADPNVVGLTSTSNFFGNALALGRAIKAARPETTIVLGGPHVSGQVEHAMRHTCFDYGCIGEGELTALELVEALTDGRDPADVPGLGLRKNGEVVRTAPRPLVQDLDTLPMPARHLLPIKRYTPQPNDGPYLPKFAMISSRGCPFRCIFCDHGTFGNSYRSFSAGRIVDEMEDLVNRYGARDIAFVDSLFMISEKRVTGIVDEILRRDLRVHWTCTVRANIATPEVLERIKAAGCWRVRIGVEAGNEQVLNFIEKGVTKDEIRAVARAADRLKLHPKAFFMIGHPTETEAEIRESIAFAKSLPVTDITVQINTPLPGAPQYEFCERYGTLVSDNLEDYSFWQPVFIPHGLTRERMERLFRVFYLSFYFRPIVILRHLRMVRRFSDVQRYWRALTLVASRFLRLRVGSLFHTIDRAREKPEGMS